MYEKTNPQAPCTEDEIGTGIAYAERKYQLKLHIGTVRGIFNRAQQRFERGQRFMSAAVREARQLRIDRETLRALVAAVGAMGRYRQQRGDGFPACMGALQHPLAAANDPKGHRSDRSFLYHDMMFVPFSHPSARRKPEQLQLL